MTTITLPGAAAHRPRRWQTQLIFIGRSLRHSLRQVDALVMGSPAGDLVAAVRLYLRPGDRPQR